MAAHLGNAAAQRQVRRLLNQRAATDIMRLASEQEEANVSSIMSSRREQQEQQRQQRVVKQLGSWRSKLHGILHTAGLRASNVGNCGC